MTTLYEKRGRRYVPWGNLAEDRWHRDGDIMPIGTFRLVHCPSPGCTRTFFDIQPDTAAFLAASVIARQAMEEAIHARAIMTPSANATPYTPKQQAILKEFRQRMADAGGLLPTYWNAASAYQIAEAGVEAVRRWHEEHGSENRLDTTPRPWEDSSMGQPPHHHRV